MERRSKQTAKWEPVSRGDSPPGFSRNRLLSSARRAVLVLVTGAVLASSAVCLLATVLVFEVRGGHSTPDRWVRVAFVYLVGIGLLSLMAYAFVVRSTRFVEVIFRQEDHLIRSVGHEVQNPIGRLVAVIDQGRNGSRSPEEALAVASELADELGTLVDDLLLLARVLIGFEAPPGEEVDLAALVTAAAARTAGDQATVTVDAEPAVVTGSEKLMRIMVTNLIRNAARHAYFKGPGEIRIRVDDTGIVVSDDGPGLPENWGGELDCSTALAPTGTVLGLGLTTAGRVAETYGGQIVLSDRSEGGVDARVHLPVLKPSTNERAV